MWQARISTMIKHHTPTMHKYLLALLCLLIGMPAAIADDASDEETAPVPEERQVTTRHSVRIDGETINYRAVAGTMNLEDDEDQAAASIFYIAYLREGVDDPARRPITFSFNGGPGSSSVWLHLGVFGPRRVVFDDAEYPLPPPYDITDNPYSILDQTDLVFIDPVGTGFSRTVGEGEDSDYLGVEEDVEAVGDFIREYVSRNNRWNSPKFLAGESYGTTRAAGLVNHLQNRGMNMNGVLLVSSILNFQTARFEPGNDLPYILFLPTYAATAWYHDALPDKPEYLQVFLNEVRGFAMGDYATALMQGDQLPEAQRNRIAAQLAAYTGLSESYLRQTNLRIHIQRFTKELLRDRRHSVGRLDSRYLGQDADAAGERPDQDPSYAAILGPYTAALNAYVRSELGFEEEREYEILSFDVNRNWNWQVPSRAGYVNTAEDLRQAMTRDPHLQVYVANGYYDLATPFFATEYTMDHLGLEARLKDNIQMDYYPAGHMMYIHPDSLEAMRTDLVTFYGSALQNQP